MSEPECWYVSYLAKSPDGHRLYARATQTFQDRGTREDVRQGNCCQSPASYSRYNQSAFSKTCYPCRRNSGLGGNAGIGRVV